MAKKSPTLNRMYGWRPDLPDARDRRFDPRANLKLGERIEIPPAVDLRAFCPPVYDQGSLGSCTGNAIAGAHHYDQMAQGEKAFPPSRLFIYYNERVIEGSVNQDAGAAIRDGIKTIAKQGVCSESLCAYNVAAFKARPSKRAYDDGVKHTAIAYQRIDSSSLSAMRTCLALKRPFVFGFTVYESFESDAVARTGMVPMPADGEQALGGHAVAAVGYNDEAKRFVVRNSWGVKWGQEGYFEIPYDYLLNPNLADDFWTIQRVK